MNTSDYDMVRAPVVGELLQFKNTQVQFLVLVTHVSDDGKFRGHCVNQYNNWFMIVRCNQKSWQKISS